MPTIGSQIPQSFAKCERCGNKRKESRKWTEKIKTANGTTIIQHAQIVCVNSKCQAAFDLVLIDDSKKREALRLIRSEESAKRKSKRTKKPLVLSAN